MIPLTKPWFDDKELSAVEAVIRSGWVTQGPVVAQFEAEFAAAVGAGYAVAVANCTIALEMSLVAVGVRAGDVVLTVSHSFIATANCIRRCGAEPAFLEISANSFNMDCIALERFLEERCEKRDGVLYLRDVSALALGSSPLAHLLALGVPLHRLGRVSAILPVHQIGVPCDIEKIVKIADRVGIPVVEDAACAVGSEFRSHTGEWKRVGSTIGKACCFSFHPRKILTTGDGGMITCNDGELDNFFRLYRQHGMSISDVKRHAATAPLNESYEIAATNARLTDVQAAIGRHQLAKVADNITAREKLAGRYYHALENHPVLSPFKVPTNTRWNYQSLLLLIRNPQPGLRNKIIGSLYSAGIAAKPGIMNAHTEKPYLAQKWNLPVSESVRDASLIVPLFPEMTNSQVDDVLNTLTGVSY